MSVTAADKQAEVEQIAAAKLSNEEREARERRISEGIARVRIVPGQIWERHYEMHEGLQLMWQRWLAKNPALPHPPQRYTRFYEVEHSAQDSLWSRLVTLMNVQTGGRACLYCDRLEKGEDWRLVE